MLLLALDTSTPAVTVALHDGENVLAESTTIDARRLLPLEEEFFAGDPPWTAEMLRWHLQQGRQAIPKSVTPSRIAENFDIFDFELTADQLAAIDALDTGVRGGPEPAQITRENFGIQIPEA